MMLPPRQARVFARLARWQLAYTLAPSRVSCLLASTIVEFLDAFSVFSRMDITVNFYLRLLFYMAIIAYSRERRYKRFENGLKFPLSFFKLTDVF